MIRTADVVIVGGGVTGASIAFQLAACGVRHVVLLERRFLGAGGTGRSVGIIRQLYPTPEASRMVLRSLDVFEAFSEMIGGSSGYVAAGALIGVGHDAHARLSELLAVQRTIGIRAEILDPAAVSEIEPRIDTRGVGAVLYEPRSGYGDPVGVTAGYAAAARRRGVQIEQGAEVVEIVQADGRVAGVTLSSGECVMAPIVVNAAGLWSPAVAQMAGVRLPITIGRHPVFVVERDADFGPTHPVYLDLVGGSYVRPETGGLTLTGSLTDDETQHPMDPELLGSDVGLDEAVPVLERSGRAVPRLREARYRGGWAGAFDITPDWMPILDESPLPGFFIAAGMSGHGFKLAPAVGEMMASLITAATPAVNAAPFRFDRFATPTPPGTFVSSYLGGA